MSDLPDTAEPSEVGSRASFLRKKSAYERHSTSSPLPTSEAVPTLKKITEDAQSITSTVTTQSKYTRDGDKSPVGKKSPKPKDKGYADICKYILFFIISRVGLTIVVAGYSVMGGFLFQYLESSSEILQRTLIGWKRGTAVAKLWNVTTEMNILYQKNWSDIANEIMKEFQEEVVSAIRDKGWNGREDENADVQWSFPGALLYSITIITTIGYGHIVPKTTPGRIATILYALLGIPITLLWISILGKSWAKCFRFCFRLGCNFCYRNQETPLNKRAEVDPKAPIRVPLYVSLIIIFSYIAGGSLLFTIWEKDWDTLIAAYFCFITLSTIGFGDYVFGVGKELDSNAKLITSAVYLLMGLAIVAMCFDLMQEEVKTKCRILGKRLGLVKKKPQRSYEGV